MIWEVYIEDNMELIKRDVLAEVPHPNGGGGDWTCVESNAIKEKEENREIGLHGFNDKSFE